MPLSLANIRQDSQFRPATMEDAELLYSWRRSAEDRGWYDVEPTDQGTHLRWLAARIGNPLVHILIWGNNDGFVRIDSNGELAFGAVNDEVALDMLIAACSYATEYGGRLKASVDQADQDSIRLLQAAGFELFPVKYLDYRP